MAEFMRLSIKDHPSITSEMLKFIWYIQLASYASHLDIRLTAVDYLQFSDQGNIYKVYTCMKNSDPFKNKSGNSLKILR